MADVRALLKAKRQEARVTHPYASYNASGALRCTACGAAVKFASAWEGHLGSKSHRVAVANLRAKEEVAAASRAALSKRSAEDDADDAQMEVEGDAEVDVQPKAKRQRTEEREVDVDVDEPTRTTFPADFFSDPSRAPPTQEDDEDDDEEMGGTATVAAAPPPPKSQFDLEWAAFERDLQSLQKPALDPQEAYARATVAAEPELVPTLEGLPGQVPAGGEGAPVSELEQKISEEEERKRKMQEEHELIMDRLLEEERAQEEADTRVAALKSRVEMLKKKRELAKAKGSKAGTRT
jgi:zinc finger protein 830